MTFVCHVRVLLVWMLQPVNLWNCEFPNAMNIEVPALTACTCAAGSSERMEPKCKQCGATSTPQWRNGKTMCNACYLRDRKDKMLTKRRATAPAGYQMPFVLDSSGLPVPAEAAALTTGTGSAKEQGPPSPGRLASMSRKPVHHPIPGMTWAGAPQPEHQAAFRRLESVIAANHMAKQQQQQQQKSHGLQTQGKSPLHQGQQQHSSNFQHEMTQGGFYPSAIFPRASMMSGMMPVPSQGQPQSGRMQPPAHHQSLSGSVGPSSPDNKPTFAPEESVLRQMSLMDSEVAEVMADCAAIYADERCTSRDKGYEAGKRNMKSRISQMLVDGSEDRGDAANIGVKIEIENKAGQSTRQQEKRLLEMLHRCCARMVERWRSTQLASVSAAYEEGQRMAREDLTKHLYQCLRSDYGE